MNLMILKKINLNSSYEKLNLEDKKKVKIIIILLIKMFLNFLIIQIKKLITKKKFFIRKKKFFYKKIKFLH